MGISVDEVRRATWHHLEPNIAASADMKLAELQQFIAGTYVPSNEQIAQLARAMGLEG